MSNLGGGTIKGMDKAQKRFRDMAKRFPKITKQAMHDATIMIEERAIDNVTNAGPALLNVKTGVLVTSIHSVVKQRGGDFTVGTTGIPPHVPYGRDHELGYSTSHKRRKMRRRPWLSLAYKHNKVKIERRFERITQELLKAAK